MFQVHLRLTYLKNRRVTIDILSPDGKLPFCHGLIPATLDHTGLYILNTERFKPKAIGHLLTQTEKMVFAGITPAEIVAVMCKTGGRS